VSQYPFFSGCGGFIKDEGGCETCLSFAEKCRWCEIDQDSGSCIFKGRSDTCDGELKKACVTSSLIRLFLNSNRNH